LRGVSVLVLIVLYAYMVLLVQLPLLISRVRESNG